MATKCCEALRFITLDSKSSQNDSFFTLVETSGNDIKNDQTKNTTVEFFSDQSVKLISDIIKTKLVNRKRKH